MKIIPLSFINVCKMKRESLCPIFFLVWSITYGSSAPNTPASAAALTLQKWLLAFDRCNLALFGTIANKNYINTFSPPTSAEGLPRVVELYNANFRRRSAGDRNIPGSRGQTTKHSGYCYISVIHPTFLLYANPRDAYLFTLSMAASWLAGHYRHKNMNEHHILFLRLPNRRPIHKMLSDASSAPEFYRFVLRMEREGLDLTRLMVLTIQLDFKMTRQKTVPLLESDRVTIMAADLLCMRCYIPMHAAILTSGGESSSYVALRIEQEREKFLPLMTTFYPNKADVESGAPVALKGRPGLTRWISPNILWHLLHAVGNHTMRYRPYDTSRQGKGLTSRPVYENRTTVIKAVNYVYGVEDTVIHHDEYFFNFISCYRYPAVVSWRYLGKPFDRASWVLLSVLVLVFWGLIFFTASPIKSACGAIVIVIVVLRYFLDNSTSLLRICDHSGKKLAFAMLLFTALLFNNMYKGHITSDVTAPAAQRQAETISDLERDDFKILSELDKNPKVNISKWYQDKEAARSDRNSTSARNEDYRYAHLGTEIDLYIRDIIVTIFNRKSPNTCSGLSEVKLMFCKEKYRWYSFKRRIRMPNGGPAVHPLHEVAEGGKTALFVESTYLKTLTVRDVLMKRKTGQEAKPQFYFGKEKYLTKPFGVAFIRDGVNGRYLSNLYKRLAVESGLVRYIADRYSAQNRSSLLTHYMENEMATSRKTKPLSLKSNTILSLLGAFAMLLSACSFAFVLELIAGYGYRYGFAPTRWAIMTTPTSTTADGKGRRYSVAFMQDVA